MARKKNVKISAILKMAESLGYDAHEVIWQHEIQPMYELNEQDWDLSDFDDDNDTYVFPKETRLTMRAFFASINTTSIRVRKD